MEKTENSTDEIHRPSWYDPNNKHHPSPELLYKLGFDEHQMLEIKLFDGVAEGLDLPNDWREDHIILHVVHNLGGSVDLTCFDSIVVGESEDHDDPDDGYEESRDCYCIPCPTDEETFRLVIKLFKEHGDFSEAR